MSKRIKNPTKGDVVTDVEYPSLDEINRAGLMISSKVTFEMATDDCDTLTERIRYIMDDSQEERDLLLKQSREHIPSIFDGHSLSLIRAVGAAVLDEAIDTQFLASALINGDVHVIDISGEVAHAIRFALDGLIEDTASQMLAQWEEESEE